MRAHERRGGATRPARSATTQCTDHDLSRSTWTVERWLPSLEATRGLAALAVVVHHAVHDTYGVHGRPSLELAGWLGSWGVALFFVLSGFCIHLPQARAAAAGELGFNPRRFFAARARRLLPAYYAALLLACLAAAWFPTRLLTPATPRSLLAHVFLVHVWTGDFYGINAVLWSVAVEVHFYLGYPLYLWARRRLPGALLFGGALTLGLACYLAATLVTRPGSALRLAGQSLFLVTWWQWIGGALLAEVYVRGQRSWLSRALMLPAAPLLWGSGSLALGLVDPTVFGLHLRYWILPIACLLLLGSVVVRPAGPLTRVATASRLGACSYSLYLVHPIALAVVLGVLPAKLNDVIVLAGVVASVIAAWCLYLVCERPVLRTRPNAVLQSGVRLTTRCGLGPG